MRSRPDLKLYLSPKNPCAGRRLRADAVLVSRSETPIEGVEFHLRGVERRQASTTRVNDTTIVGYAAVTHVDLFGRTPPATLPEGKYTASMTFDLPAAAPPSHRSAYTLIEYTLEVRVVIPWWPDRYERYELPLLQQATSFRASPRSFCSDARGAHGGSLYFEVSLDSTTVAVGGVVTGAASLANVARHRVRRVELSLVGVETAAGGGSGGEVVRYTVVIHEGSPVDSRAIPFRVRFPADATPSFRGALVELRWSVEVRAVIAFGDDELLTVPIEVVRTATGAPAAPVASSRVPPVGRERRALVWAEVARKQGLDNDPENERMTRDLGGGGSLEITLEAGQQGGLVTVARVRFPRLGIGLSVSERRWTDALARGGFATGDRAFDERFTARGREEAQLAAFLDPAACKALRGFDRVSVDDGSATLEAASAAQSSQELNSLVARALSAARALLASAARVPPPAAMAAHAEAWRAFAGLTSGKFQVGGMAITDAVFEHLALEIATEWGDDGAPASTAVRLFLPRGVDGSGDDPPGPDSADDDRPAELNAAARSLLAELQTRSAAIEITRRRLEAAAPAPLADPHTLLPLLEGLVRLARAVEGEQGRGPYR